MALGFAGLIQAFLELVAGPQCIDFLDDAVMRLRLPIPPGLKPGARDYDAANPVKSGVIYRKPDGLKVFM